jgi:hypothetical protein
MSFIEIKNFIDSIKENIKEIDSIASRTQLTHQVIHLLINY